MVDRRRLLASVGVCAGLLVIAAPALACTNFVGKTTITGNASSASTVSTGLQCADDVGGFLGDACDQAMTVTTGTGNAQAHLGGTLEIQTTSAGATCAGQSTFPCYLNNSSSINYPVGNTGYDVNIINVGFSSHNSNPTAAQDCATPNGSTNPLIKVATVSVSGGAGVLSGAAGANGYTASFSSTTHTATVAVPGSPWVVNTGTQEAGMCISDTMGEDGTEVTFTIVS